MISNPEQQRNGLSDDSPDIDNGTTIDRLMVAWRYIKRALKSGLTLKEALTLYRARRRAEARRHG